VREPVFFDQRSLGLRSVPLDASAGAVRLDAAGGFPSTSFSGAIGVLNGVPFAVSADSSRVIYLWYPTGASNEDVASRGLYSVRVDGSAAPLTLRAGGVSYDIATSLVGSRAYFVADATGAAVDTLYGIDLLGTNLVQISDKLARDTFSDVSVPTPTPTAAYALVDGGERVVHAADATVDQRFELFSGRTDGGSLPQPLGSGGLVSGLRTSPDGSRAVYSDGDLYSVPTDGSGPRVKLFDGPSADELIADNFQVSPDGARVVFRSSFESGPERLLSVPSAGGTAVELEDDHVLHFVLGASRAVYVIIDSSLNHRLFSVPMDGSSAPIPLDGNNLPDNGRPVLTPDLTHAVYNSGFGVAIVPVDGSSGPLVLSGTPYTYGPRVSPDGQWVVFSQRPSLFQFIFELYSARLDGSSGPLKLNAPLVSGGNLVTSNDSAAFAISPDSTRVVYVADQEQDERFELYSVPIDDSVSPVKLNEPLPVGGDVYAVGPDYEHVQIAPDSSRVVYVADQNVNDRLELYSVPLAGGPTIPLNGTFVSGGNIAVGSGAPFLISPDSSLVVYRADQTIDNLFDIFLVPIDRFFEPRALTGGFARPGVTFPTITPDSRRVVYQATERLGVTELFSSALSFIPERNHLKNGDARRP
jgi:Tol biopolymer transport system component